MEGAAAAAFSGPAGASGEAASLFSASGKLRVDVAGSAGPDVAGASAKTVPALTKVTHANAARMAAESSLGLWINARPPQMTWTHSKRIKTNL
jgi:hypothetical protein